MDAWVWIAIAVAAVIVIVGVATRSRRSAATRNCGSSSDPSTTGRSATPATFGAASRSCRRRERREQLNIRPLDPDAAKEYGRRWDETQRRFVDDPEGALADADGLIVRVMRDRGYPMDDFDQRSADISVDHPDVVEHYRSAHDISTRARDDGRRVSTEDMRQGLVHYRELFARLLGPDDRRATA